MRAINQFMAISLILAIGMTAIHFGVLHVLDRIRRDRAEPLRIEHAARAIDGGVLMSLSSDYEHSVLPDQERNHAAWIERAREEAKRLATANGVITSDDVWDTCPPPPGVDPRVMGAIFSDKVLWERTGYGKSTRKINHGRPVAQWRLRGTI